jgi:hypothetical protein
MKDIPCLCDGRSGIRCDETHCDLAGPGRPGEANECRVCWLRLATRSPLPCTHGRGESSFSPLPRSGGEGRERGVSLVRRSLPCVYLGDVKDRVNCPCPKMWVRACALHSECTLEQCKVCPDYEEGL